MTRTRALSSLALTTALSVAALTACGSTPSPRTPGAASAAPGQAGDGTPATVGGVTELATGLDMPWGLTFLPDGSALVSGRASGQIHHIPAGGGRADPVGGVPDVSVSAEGGLLGLAASPDFARDRTVYAYVSSSPTNRVVALRVSEDMGSLSRERVVLEGIETADRHHGGRLRFGPEGDLWIGTGDAFEPGNAAEDDSLNGKILRVRPDGSVPEGNPGGSPVYSSGHRNVQGIAFGPDGTAYASELGHRTWDELNVPRPGLRRGPDRQRTDAPA
ncbi:glucose/arabinose dehydrogenase [Nocardiopsis arvandica]|uniref:Glucose/arabinose dehydrogenase n=1 Tax=Nocardiopsis sinuspersici TaxID=501010 RepID=A0A7Y9XE79_9ACTN|nr:PQQ-dependent sugar dehydrogenase [Nocardiopsis sinuspersici]NYH53202.1 glucose/arabinose dehydrogenase [Nocardiopsis sinuspersici]